jgi:hypothetical protein
MTSMGFVVITLDGDDYGALEDVYWHIVSRFSPFDDEMRSAVDLPIRKLPNQDRWRLRFVVEPDQSVLGVVQALEAIRLI